MGDLVIVKDKCLRQWLVLKLQHPYKGPYIIKDVHGQNVVSVLLSGGNQRRCSSKG